VYLNTSRITKSHYRTTRLTYQELAIFLHKEVVIDSAEVEELWEVCGYGTKTIFKSTMSKALEYFQKVPTIDKYLISNPKTYLTQFYKDKGLTGNILTQKVDNIMEKINEIVQPYRDLSLSYHNSEERLLGGLRVGAKTDLFNDIVHSGDRQLELISTRTELSSLLFGSGTYIKDFVKRNTFDKKISPGTLMRMKFFVTKWQTSDFEGLQIPIRISNYGLQVLKSSVIENIDNWIKSNPYKGDLRQANLYIAETFTKHGQSYSKEDLYPDFKLANNLIFAAMERNFIEYKKKNPGISITEVPVSAWSPSLPKLEKELNTVRHLYKSLTSTSGGPRFWSESSLQAVLQVLSKWHKDEFGERGIGLTYLGREENKITYNREDPEVQDLLYYYHAAIKSIYSYAQLRNIDLNSPTTANIALGESLKSKNELVMNQYDIQYWDKDTTKAFHIIYHLCRYLGFDPMTFTPLDDNIFKGGEKAGGYRRHHFLALMFRKMSSHVDDIVLTSDDFHISEYEGLLRKEGLDAEIFIKQLMKSLVELIEMKDQNGNFLKINEHHMREVLYKNFGEIKGEKVLEKWKGQKDFVDSLRKFNSRRQYALKGEYEQFLKLRYKNAYSAYYKKVIGPTYTKILATQSNLDFLTMIYLIPFTLKPVQRRL